MRIFTVILIFLALLSCAEKKQESQWVSLWNGEDFSGWHSYLGTPYTQVTDSLGNPIAPFGVDNDPLEVIRITDTEAGPAIRISGVAWGMLYSEADYSNYHLKLQYKWGEAMHPPRENGPRDSGLLYHGFGEPGSAYFWMNSQELQVQEGDMGDYWPVGDVEIDIPSTAVDDKYYKYQANAPLRTYYFADIVEEHLHDSLSKRRVKTSMPKNRMGHGMRWN